MEKATFGAGCFWGVEDLFRKVEGVADAVSGYEGGTLDNPTYKDVCTNTSGHAEVVEVDFDPAQVSYATLLETFWKMHDPTTLNRQGPDTGTQYRSVIFFHTPEQQQAAKTAKAAEDQSGRHASAIVTEIVPAETFWRAEEYHQRYFEKNGGGGCHIV
jgi:peptide-methionine (S)-S-oxide reductase